LCHDFGTGGDVMGFSDKAREFAAQHDDKVDEGLKKAGDAVDERTDQRYTDQIDKGVDEAQERTRPNQPAPDQPA